MKVLILTLALLSTPAFAAETHQLTFRGHHGPGLHCYVMRDGENTFEDAEMKMCSGQSTEIISRFNQTRSDNGQTVSIDDSGRSHWPDGMVLSHEE